MKFQSQVFLPYSYSSLHFSAPPLSANSAIKCIAGRMYGSTAKENTLIHLSFIVQTLHTFTGIDDSKGTCSLQKWLCYVLHLTICNLNDKHFLNQLYSNISCVPANFREIFESFQILYYTGCVSSGESYTLTKIPKRNAVAGPLFEILQWMRNESVDLFWNVLKYTHTAHAHWTLTWCDLKRYYGICFTHTCTVGLNE